MARLPGRWLARPLRLDVLLGRSEVACHLAEHLRFGEFVNLTLTANYTSGYSDDSGGLRWRLQGLRQQRDQRSS